METKLCRGCETEQALDSFPLNGRYRASRCAPCWAAYSLERQRAYRAEHPEKIREANQRSRAYRLEFELRKHGITRAQFDAELERQGGGCAICGSTRNGARRLAVDHDHSHCASTYGCPECIRGILCGACNAREGRNGAADLWAEYIARPRPFAQQTQEV